MTNTYKITDFDIQALVDGEIDHEHGLSLLEAIRRDPALYGRYVTFKKQKDLLKSWWKDN